MFNHSLRTKGVHRQERPRAPRRETRATTASYAYSRAPHTQRLRVMHSDPQDRAHLRGALAVPMPSESRIQLLTVCDTLFTSMPPHSHPFCTACTPRATRAFYAYVVRVSPHNIGSLRVARKLTPFSATHNTRTLTRKISPALTSRVNYALTARTISNTRKITQHHIYTRATPALHAKPKPCLHLRLSHPHTHTHTHTLSTHTHTHTH